MREGPTLVLFLIDKFMVFVGESDGFVIFFMTNNSKSYPEGNDKDCKDTKYKFQEFLSKIDWY